MAVQIRELIIRTEIDSGPGDVADEDLVDIMENAANKDHVFEQMNLLTGQIVEQVMKILKRTKRR